MLESLTDWLLQFARRPYRVPLARHFGRLANDRERAAAFGHKRLRSVLAGGREVVLDFTGVEVVTQGFFHALLAESVVEDPRRVRCVRAQGANRRQLATLELSLRLLLETHDPQRRAGDAVVVRRADAPPPAPPAPATASARS